MAKGAGPRGKRAAKAGEKAPQRPRKAARSALGNDPFERGAATPVAVPAGAETTRPVTATATPNATPAKVLEQAERSGRAPFAARTDASAGRSELPPAAGRSELPPAGGRSETPPVEFPARVPPAEPTSVAARLRELAIQEATGDAAREVAAVLRRAWPALRARLEVLGTIRRLFDGPGPLDAYGMDPELVSRAAPALDFLLDAWWRVEVRGVEHVPAGAAIVVANHGGRFHWDALVLAHVLRRAGRELRPLLDEHALSTPLAGRAALRLGAVPASPENALAVLRAGKLAAVFPEGSRNGDRAWPDRYRIRRFGRGGFARLAIAARAPVVPCAIVGSEETTAPPGRPGWLADALALPLLGGVPGLPLGPLAFVPLPSRWTLRFGEPIAPPAGGSADDAGLVNALAGTARDTLQRMLDEDVASRRSAYL